MIHLTRLNGQSYVLNADLIETLESTPDTTITLISGHKMNVLEPVPEVVARVIDFRRSLQIGPEIVFRARSEAADMPPISTDGEEH